MFSISNGTRTGTYLGKYVCRSTKGINKDQQRRYQQRHQRKESSSNQKKKKKKKKKSGQSLYHGRKRQQLQVIGWILLAAKLTAPQVFCDKPQPVDDAWVVF
jgi:hypothetical protein